MEINLQDPVTNSNVYSLFRYIMRHGYEFRAYGQPVDIMDCIVIKEHPEKWYFAPRTPPNIHTLEQHIDFINNMKLEKALLIVESNIKFITRCPTLRYVRFCLPETADDGLDYSPLYEMRNIRDLNCITEYGSMDEKHTTVDYSFMPWLERVCVTSKWHRNFQSFSNLKSLYLARYKADSLDGAFCSRQLDTFTMFRCGVKSLDGIEHSQKMQCLYISDDRRLSDISALEKVSGTLKALHIENCSKITDFSVLEKLENLEYLRLWGSNTIPSLGFLKSLKKLTFFGFEVNVADGDLTPCLNLPSAHCKNRRHYNLKCSELPLSKDILYGNEDIEPWRRIMR